jgi:hypothetical protein
MGGIGVWMLVLVVCWWMFRHYRTKTKCVYCGAEWSKHNEDCPLGGSGV